MSQLNFYRLSILFFALVTVVTPMSRAAALQMQRQSPSIKEDACLSFKQACDKIQDEQSCQALAKGRDCSWTDGKCQCVPEELAFQSTLNSAGMMLLSLTTGLAGLGLLLFRDCGSEKCEPYKTISGALLVVVSAVMVNGARIVAEDRKALLS
jgi:hypothetical protein